MATMLYVASSVRTSGSQSAELAHFFVEHFTKKAHDTQLIERDIGINPPPHPTPAYAMANYTPPDQRTPDMIEALKISDELIDELITSDYIVFAIPMYNFSVPSNFKAYIDQVVRAGRTFAVTDNGSFEGLLKNKKVLVVTTRGLVYNAESPIRTFDHQEPYLRTIFGFMGLTDITFVNADGMLTDESYKSQQIEEAQTHLTDLATAWSA